MTVTHLTCNYAINPLGVETLTPVFNWAVEDGRQDARQLAYQIVVASSESMLDAGSADIWDSGEVASDQSCGIRRTGLPLQSAKRYWWKVRVADSGHEWSHWTRSQWFETGLLHERDWRAKWICLPIPFTPERVATPDPAPFFRKTLRSEKDVAQVRAYVSGLGYYELYINGKKCGDAVLSPAVSQYDRSVYYDTHDISASWRSGDNVVGVILGNGWYESFTEDVWDFHTAPWRHVRKLLLQVEVTYADGEKTIVGSDSTWRATTGPIVFDGLRNGETYDARLELRGWNVADYDDRSWKPAQIVRSPGGRLRSAQLPDIREIEEIEPRTVTELGEGVHLFDFGKNISGWGKLNLNASEGSEIVLKYGERVDGDGTLDTEDIDVFVKSGEFQTDRYVAGGSGRETWHPRFSYHGFQYIQSRGLPYGAGRDALHAVVVHTALADAGAFECSNPLLNKIQELSRRSTLTNYHSFPTDCPHREKNGWTGDALLSAEQVLLNFDPITAYRKWLFDIVDAQRPSGQIPGIVPSAGWGFNWGSGPAWDSALILIPWYMYLYAADREILEWTYDAMVRYLDFLGSMESGGIVDFGLGDWCPPTGGPSGSPCPTAVTDTAYAYTDFLSVSRIAKVLGRLDDAKAFGERAARIRAAFRNAFLNVATGSVAGDSQTSLSCALYQGLVDEQERQLVLTRLVDAVETSGRHLDTGILGTKYLLHTLSRHGRADLAYAIVTRTDFPSWGHWIAQGATTLWEQWDGQGSRNHHMFSDVSAWFYRELAGLQPDSGEPGFKHTRFRPNPVPDLEWTRAHHLSPYGPVESEWSVDSDSFRLSIRIPANCHGTVDIPAGYSNGVRLDGAPAARDDNGSGSGPARPVLQVGSGRHEIVSMRSR